jgi:hypothetical protein
MSTNTIFGTGNIIEPIVTNSLAEGQNNRINEGNVNHIGGFNNIIEKGDYINIIGVNNKNLSGNANNLEGLNNQCEGDVNHCGGIQNFVSGQGNLCYGAFNEIKDNDNTNITLSYNSIKGLRNKIGVGQNIHITGINNNVPQAILTTVEGEANKVDRGVVTHVEGRRNLIERPVGTTLQIIHLEGQDNKIIFNGDHREGSNMTGQKGYFLFDENKSFPEDTYNYSNQLAGGGGPLISSFPGEGISMIDRTIVNGIYPLGKCQSYLNTADGLSYSIMMKGDSSLKNGTFVTLDHKDCCKCNKKSNERILTVAKNNKEVIGVITKSSGFIVNAGQFAASERIQYDEYHTPIIKLNIATLDNLTNEDAIKLETIKFEHEEIKEIEIKECIVKESNIKIGELLSPAFLTVPINDVDRSVPFIPFDERPNYYQVALLGSVIVNANFRKRDRHHLKCDVKDGIAVPGTKYFIIKFIDKTHLQILLK